MDKETKKCTKCNLEKKLNDFYKWKNLCKVCCSLKNNEYRLKNLKKMAEINKIWRQKTKELRKNYAKEYQKKKRKEDAIFNLRSSLSRNIRTAIKRNHFGKNSNTLNIIGCSFEQFKIHIESKWEPWMNWNNHGKYNGEFNYGWDFDHIIPISSAKTEEDIIKLNHWTNFQPLCSKINRQIKRNYL